MKKNFALLGVGGYIAPRHLQAIYETGNVLVASCDPNDSVGILDRFFPSSRFFTEFERFDRHLEKLRRAGSSQKVDFLSVCSPNYLHDAHARLGLRLHADVICEKPLVLSPWNIDALHDLESEFEKRVYTVLQLRLLPSLIELRETIAKQDISKKHAVQLHYITRRGPWYKTSWKGNEEKSGGIATNIGIHFFDLLMWIFGECKDFTVRVRQSDKMAGTLELAKAHVDWFLSIDENDLPESCRDEGNSAFRSITVDGTEIEFSSGFTHLHTRVYEDILAGGGFRLEDVRPSIELVHRLRSAVLKP